VFRERTSGDPPADPDSADYLIRENNLIELTGEERDATPDVAFTNDVNSRMDILCLCFPEWGRLRALYRLAALSRIAKDHVAALKAAGNAAAADRIARTSGYHLGEGSIAPAPAAETLNAFPSSMALTDDGTRRLRNTNDGADDNHNCMHKGTVADIQDDDFQWYVAHQSKMFSVLSAHSAAVSRLPVPGACRCVFQFGLVLFLFVLSLNTTVAHAPRACIIRPRPFSLTLNLLFARTSRTCM
jgi:hypothetical protein